MRREGTYWDCVRQVAAELGSDGCTGVPDFFLDACLEHDVHYRLHKTVSGQPITRQEADTRFREGIQHASYLGVCSPMAWWRWAGVRLFGGSSWVSKPSSLV